MRMRRASNNHRGCCCGGRGIVTHWTPVDRFNRNSNSSSPPPARPGRSAQSMNNYFFTHWFVAVAALFATAIPTLAAGWPDTPLRPVTNVYHGVTVVDNYRWLENFNDPEVKQWSAAQNAITRGYLENLPARSNIVKRLEKIYSKTAATYSALQSRPGLLFALKFQPPAQQPWLVTLKSPNDLSSERVVLDPNKLNSKGTTAIDFYAPSLDGKRVAVSLSENGSENGTLFFYGTTAEFAEKSILPRIAEIALKSRDDGRYLLATVANGDGGEFALYLLGSDGHWTQLTSFTDQIKQGEFGKDDCLYLLSTKDAPHGKILRHSLTDPVAAVYDRRTPLPVIVPPTEAVIENFCPTANGLYVQDLMGGPSQIRYLGGAGVRRVPLKDPVSAVLEILPLKGDELLFDSVSYTAPYAWSEFNPATKKIRSTGLVGKSPADFSNVEVLREFATSKDGTKIPMNIIRPKKLKLDGENPTLLYGYGGYSISMTPGFSAARSLWLDHGGVYVVANLRGGGEFGEEWHKAGSLTHKQNVFDDFAACAQWLIDKKYTQSSKLAAEGGSNGGLLMGAFLTQHPNLVRVVVSHVGIYDSLRTELEPNGAFNVTEFGSVQDPDQFKALYAYSPYHHVADGVRYPSLLLLTGDNDGRVNPYNSRKFAARLQAASRDPFPSPVLLRTTSSAGHGIGSSLDERISQEADVYAFLFDQLEMPWDKKAAAAGRDVEP